MNLRDYQLQAVANWHKKPNILFEERTGKTAVGLEIALQFKAENVMIILNQNATQSWFQAIKTPKYQKLSAVCLAVASHFSRDIYFDKHVKHRIPKELDLLIVDEADMYKNLNSKRTKMLLQLAKQAKHVIALTATPSSKGLDIDDIFTLMLLTRTLPKVKGKQMSLNQFHKTYCDQKLKFMSSQRRIFEYKLKQDKAKQLYKHIDSVSSKASIERADGARAEIIPYYFDYESNLGLKLSKSKLKQLDFGELRKMIGDMLAQSGIENEALIEATLYGKAQQESVHVTKEYKKADEVRKLLAKLPKNKPIVICYNYIEELRQISQLLELSNVLYIKDKNDIPKIFEQNTYTYIVSHVGTLARGVELNRHVDNIIIYSLTHDFVVFKQLESRLNTINSKSAGNIYYMLGTAYSREMYDRMLDKKELLSAITRD